MPKGTDSAQSSSMTLRALNSGRSRTRVQAIISISGISGPYIGGAKRVHSGKNAQEQALLLDGDLGSDVNVTVDVSWARGRTAWQGFTLNFDFGTTNETDGFGVRYKPAAEDPEKAKVELSRQHTIVVSFAAHTPSAAPKSISSLPYILTPH